MDKRSIFSMFLIFIFLIINPVNAVVINEILPNPDVEPHGEWIELYNNGTEISLTNWNITDGEDTFTIPNISLAVNEFLVLVYNETQFKKTWNATKIVEYGARAKNLKLTNNGDDLILYDNFNNTIDSFSWSSDPGENISFGRYDDNWTTFSNPTPGSQNIFNQSNETNVKLSVYLANVIVLNQTYTSLFKIEIKNKNNCSKLDNVTVFYRITNDSAIIKESNFTREIGCSSYANTGEWTPNQTGNFTLYGIVMNSTMNGSSAWKNITVIDPFTIPCDLSLKINSDVIVNASEQMTYYIEINDTNCNNIEHPITINYWIEDLFGNIIKNPYEKKQEIICYKSITREWTPDEVTGSEAFVIKANITNPYCNDSNPDNFGERIIIVKGSPQSENKSYIKMTVKNDEVKYGESIDVELEIYRNSTNKYAIYVWVENSEKLSEITTIHIKTKNSLYKIRIPVQLKPNCDERYPNGNFTIIAEGLDVADSDNISINGISSSMCKKEYISSGGGTTEIKIVEKPYEIISYQDSVYVDEEFTTKIKIKNSGNVKNFTVYSYVYEGQKILSHGFDGKRWRKTWNANEKNIELQANSSAIIELNNMIKNETPGKYNLRVRIKTAEEKYDITREITLNEKPYLNVEKNNSFFKVETNCVDCQINIITPKTEFVIEKNYFEFEANETGRYYFILNKNSKTLQKKIINLEPEKEMKTEKTSIIRENPITGLVTESRKIILRTFNPIFFYQVLFSLFNFSFPN